MAFGTLAAVLTPTLDVVDDFLTLDLLDDFGLDRSAVNQRGAKHRAIAAQHQNFVELDFFASIRSQSFHSQHVAAGNFVLLAAGLEDRKHRIFLYLPRPVAPGLRAFVAGSAASDSAPVRASLHISCTHMRPEWRCIRGNGLPVKGKTGNQHGTPGPYARSEERTDLPDTRDTCNMLGRQAARDGTADQKF